MKRLDLVLVVLVLAVAGVLYGVTMGGAKQGGTAVVTVDGAVKKELPLTENTQYRLETEQGYNVIEIQDGKAKVIEADCRDGLCTEQRSISKTGETIVCLPHKTVVTITDGQEQEVDMVVN